MGSTWAIVVAAGSGQRFGRAKQFELLDGRSLIDWSVAASAASCDGVVVVVPPGSTDVALAADIVVPGGATRSESVRAGLAMVPVEAEVVLVHDAARPGASPNLFRAVAAAVRSGATAAVPGLPVADTLKRVAMIDGEQRVLETIDRSTAVAVQTPQGFSAAALRTAHATGGDATDDAGLIERAGGTVVVVPGESSALKVTTADDLAMLVALLSPAARAATQKEQS
ncbi:MAG: 2-C-methyl-D-erythritol 4-phosphate cytidylyltransferase [Acidimicrobiales bacterium]